MKRVLVVDDEPNIRSIVSALLRAEGYAVETAANGQEALARVRADHFDAVLLDVLMPVMDGPTFVRAWRADEGYQPVPIALFTSMYNSASIGRELTVQGHVPKPFDLDHLAEVLAALVAQPTADANLTGKPATHQLLSLPGA
ncbi:MAG: response regulator [Chloroflexota bacterium]|nr:response regulator [Chloroflexota bacterium]